MNILSVRRPQIRLAGLMCGIAVIALVLGGLIAVRSAWPEVVARRLVAAGHRAEAKRWRQVIGWVDDPCLSVWRYPNGLDYTGAWEYDPGQPYVYDLKLYDYPKGEADRELVRGHRAEILALCRERVAYHERMSDRWSWSAWTPWTDPGPDGPKPAITAYRVISDAY